jgi:hypothetical protein
MRQKSGRWRVQDRSACSPPVSTASSRDYVWSPKLKPAGSASENKSTRQRAPTGVIEFVAKRSRREPWSGPSSVAKAVAQLGGVSERESNRAAARSRRPPWRDGSATGWRDGDCFRRASSNAPSFADRYWRVVRRDSQAIDYAVCASAGEPGAGTWVPARTSTPSGGRSGYPAGTNECGPVMDARVRHVATSGWLHLHQESSALLDGDAGRVRFGEIDTRSAMEASRVVSSPMLRTVT